VLQTCAQEALPLCKPKTQSFVVNTPQGASALTKALAECSGGSFSVTWAGAVSIEETMFISSKTVLSITGTADAVIDGQQRVQLFAVLEDASLSIKSITLSRGYVAADETESFTSQGGAAVILARRAALQTDNVLFVDNMSEGSFGSGAVMSVGTDATLNIVNTQFLRNSGSQGGGSISIFRGSATISNSSFMYNRAAKWSGGAVLVNGTETKVSISDTKFSGNSASQVGLTVSKIQACNTA
jgi:hypothetical protein